MELAKNIDFVKRIDVSVKKMLTDGKIDHNDIPELVLLITDLSVSSNQLSLSPDELSTAINGLYNYIMEHYNLFPTNQEEKASFEKLFNMSIKLVLFQPNVKKNCNKWFPCYRNENNQL